MSHRNRAFTLLEILLVVIIISILVAMVAPRLTGKSQEARVSVTKSDIEGAIAMALDLYELDAGVYPSTSQNLVALIEKPATSPEPLQWNGPYLKKKRVPKDPWGNDYIYESPGRYNSDYDLSSAGPDGIVGNDDDIKNWQE